MNLYERIQAKLSKRDPDEIAAAGEAYDELRAEYPVYDPGRLDAFQVGWSAASEYWRERLGFGYAHKMHGQDATNAPESPLSNTKTPTK